MLARWSKLYRLTDAEASLEAAVASLGTRYRVQHPLWALSVFADFTLLDHRLIIEVDGREHHTAAGRRKDAERTEKLNAAGWKVVRCRNEEALADPYSTVDRLMESAGLPLRTKKATT